MHYARRQMFIGALTAIPDYPRRDRGLALGTSSGSRRTCCCDKCSRARCRQVQRIPSEGNTGALRPREWAARVPSRTLSWGTLSVVVVIIMLPFQFSRRETRSKGPSVIAGGGRGSSRRRRPPRLLRSSSVEKRSRADSLRRDAGTEWRLRKSDPARFPLISEPPGKRLLSTTCCLPSRLLFHAIAIAHVPPRGALARAEKTGAISGSGRLAQSTCTCRYVDIAVSLVLHYFPELPRENERHRTSLWLCGV